MLTKAQIIQLLGRSLTSSEDANFDLLLSIAVSRLEQVLCFSLELQPETPSEETRTYDGRIDYRTQFVEPFTNVSSVKVDGETVLAADYTPKLFDNRNSDWYNSIVFDEAITGEVEITGTWGLTTLPNDLQLVLAQLFTLSKVPSNVKSKKMEDFSVTYKDAPTYDEFVLQNASTISKYSLCNLGAIRHGYVRPVYEY